jgi:cytochrome c peroxidase
MREGATPLPDPDPRLTVLEEQGKAVFGRACTQCHGGPGLSTPQATPQAPPAPVIRFHNILSQCPRPVDTATPARFALAACSPQLARNVRTYEIALTVPTPSPSGLLPAGTRIRRTSSDPGRALLTGFVGGPAPFDDWEKFDVPGLRGISKTAPYFANNSAATLEELVDHYIEFFKRVEANFVPGTVVPPIATTDGVHFDRRPTLAERKALIAYLKKL